MSKCQKEKISNALIILNELRISQQEKIHFTTLKQKPYTYNDSTNYGLTKCITDYINMSGGLAVSINSTNRYRSYVGWTDKNIRLELGDIVAIFNEKFIHIEIRKKDNYQKLVRTKVIEEINKAGSFYFNAYSFQSFHDWFFLNLI